MEMRGSLPSHIQAEHRGRTLLICGPPCQAYWLVGRTGNVGKAGYKADLDHRNFLYDEYVKVLKALSPAAFVVENVKGMLSATGRGSAIFSQVMTDLCEASGHAASRLFALSGSSAQLPGPRPRPLGFIVRAKDHGVPQARHRVIILGLRLDVVDVLPKHLLPQLARRNDPVCQDRVGCQYTDNDQRRGARRAPPIGWPSRCQTTAPQSALG